MKTDNVIGNSRNLTITVMAVATVITLLLFSSAVVTIPTIINAPAQDFGGPGYVYSVEYECGTQTNENDPQAQPGKYSTNILVHNPFTESQTVFLKVLPERGFPTKSAWVDPLVELKSVFLFTLKSDEALQIDCANITTAVGDANKLSSVFSNGLLIISHPVKVDKSNVLIQQPLFGDESLDVTAAYTFTGEESAAKHFNKVVLKVKDLDMATGEVTSTVTESIIQNTNSATTFDLKNAVKTALDGTNLDLDNPPSRHMRVAEIISVDYGVTGGGKGASKNVETIKGKFVPFVPMPDELTRTVIKWRQ